MLRTRPTPASPLVVVLLAALGGCSEGTTGPARATSVSLSVVAAGEAPAGGSGLLALERVSLVVRDVSLGSGAGGSCAEGDDAQSCERLESGPFLLEVPLDGRVRSLVAAAVRPGRYAAVRLALHTPREGDAEDAALLAAHPSLVGTSVRVEGRWDGVPFTLDRPLDDLRVLTLEPPLEVEGRTANVTLRLAVESWFVDANGLLVDPALVAADPSVAALFDRRVGDSLEAFEDADVDGVAGSD